MTFSAFIDPRWMITYPAFTKVSWSCWRAAVVWSALWRLLCVKVWVKTERGEVRAEGKGQRVTPLRAQRIWLCWTSGRWVFAGLSWADDWPTSSAPRWSLPAAASLSLWTCRNSLYMERGPLLCDRCGLYGTWLCSVCTRGPAGVWRRATGVVDRPRSSRGSDKESEQTRDPCVGYTTTSQPQIMTPQPAPLSYSLLHSHIVSGRCEGFLWDLHGKRLSEWRVSHGRVYQCPGSWMDWTALGLVQSHKTGSSCCSQPHTSYPIQTVWCFWQALRAILQD